MQTRNDSGLVCLLRESTKAKAGRKEFSEDFHRLRFCPLRCKSRQMAKGRCSLGPEDPLACGMGLMEGGLWRVVPRPPCPEPLLCCGDRQDPVSRANGMGGGCWGGAYP